MIYPSVAVLIIEKGKVLIVVHGPKSRYATAKVGLPSGRLEKNETDALAAARELQEETGLLAEVKNLMDFPNNRYVATLHHKDGVRDYSWHVFLCKKYSGKLRATEETSPLWINISDLDKYDLLPNVKQAVEAGQKSLINQLV